MYSSRQSADFDAIAEIASHLRRAAVQLNRDPSAEIRQAVSCRDALLARLAREFVPPMDRRDLASLAFRFCAPAEALAEVTALPGNLAHKVEAAADALSSLASVLPKLGKPETVQPKIAALFRCANALRAFPADPDGKKLIRFANECAACAEAVAVAAVMEM